MGDQRKQPECVIVSMSAEFPHEPVYDCGRFVGHERPRGPLPNVVKLELRANDAFVQRLFEWFESQNVSVPGRERRALPSSLPTRRIG